MCLSVTALAGATRALRPKLRYQKKALDARNKLKDGIELKFRQFVAHREYFSRRLWVKDVTSRPKMLQQDFWWVKRCF